MPSDFHYERRIVAPDIALWEISGAPSDDQWRALMRDALAWLLEQESRGKKWGVVVDPSGMSGISAEIRREAGEWRAQNMALIANTCVCASYVASSAMLRGAITAVFWFAKPVVPVSVRASQEEAHQWVLMKLNDLSATG
jgi:hypothetical protein